MATLIAAPTLLQAAGRPPKTIEEFVGRVNSAAEAVSIARMKSPCGWSEPGQTPEFDEYTVVLRGSVRVRLKDREFDAPAGHAVVVSAGEWVQYSTPSPEGAEYLAVCLPAFSPALVRRDLAPKDEGEKPLAATPSGGESAEAVKRHIQSLVDLETAGWNAKNPDLFLSIIHPDMVWPWPPTSDAHDPIDWVFVMGRFDRQRWRRSWQELFDAHDLIHNRRTTVKIELSAELDGAFAVVDIDTLWRRKADSEESHWIGRVCKMYTKLAAGEWKFISQTGALNFATVKAAR